MDVVFIGNFVNDIIVKIVGGAEEKTCALGGSVTYGSLAASTYGCSPRIITTMGNDVLDSLHIIKAHSIKLDGDTSSIKNTSYKLQYDEKYSRTLSLLEKGSAVELSNVTKRIGKPDAIFFVPVAAEFDEDLVIGVIRHLVTTHNDPGYHPIVAMDVQGFIRTFAGKRVLTRSTEEMIAKFQKLSVLRELACTTILKAEYVEAAAIVGPLSPKEAAQQLRSTFGFDVVSVTMGPLGSYLSSINTGEVYVPTFKPVVVKDETGCGDTFLASAVLEILYAQLENKASSETPLIDSGHNCLYITKEQLVLAFLAGSAAASYLVECVGPMGFATRSKILERVENGERTAEASGTKYSVTFYKAKK